MWCVGSLFRQVSSFFRPVALLFVAAVAGQLEATCDYSHVELRGRITGLAGPALEGAAVVVFVDDDPEAIFDLASGQDVWRSDATGGFVVRGVFANWAWPRWWHRFSSSVDHCGRDPRSFTLVVIADGFQVRQFVVNAKEGGIEKTSDGRYRVGPIDPVELLARHQIE